MICLQMQEPVHITCMLCAVAHKHTQPSSYVKLGQSVLNLTNLWFVPSSMLSFSLQVLLWWCATGPVVLGSCMTVPQSYLTEFHN